MMIATFNPDTARNGDVYRAARLAMLTQQMMRHIERTEASGRRVEQMLAALAEANALMR
ncbi:hypothetical protein [Mesorhizobium sp. SEMIA 3007]|uniref:hypothetical protein n=1 Tax=Mesorhizobium sp. SEMIA 3007 TaxID=1862350 RepID=UPI000AC72537|nr:hypothetical protein [Mesorhizobium sp. SEMIA 3007]